MKKLFLLGALGAPFVIFSAYGSLEERLQGALSTADTVLMNHYLRQIDADSMPLGEKKQVIVSLRAYADELVHEKKARVGVYKHAKDRALAGFGSLAAVLGLMYFGHSCSTLYREYQEKDWLGRRRNSWSQLLLWGDREAGFLWYGGLSSFVGALGTYCAYKGLTCSSQYEEIKKLRSIRTALDEKHESLGA